MVLMLIILIIVSIYGNSVCSIIHIACFTLYNITHTILHFVICNKILHNFSTRFLIGFFIKETLRLKKNLQLENTNYIINNLLNKTFVNAFLIFMLAILIS